MKIAKLISLCAVSAIVMAASGVLAVGDIAKGKKKSPENARLVTL